MMKKWFFRTLVTLCLIIGLGILFMFGAAFYLESDHARHLIRNQLNKSISGQITWSKVRISLIRGCIEVDRILIQSPSREPMIALDRIFAQVSWRALLSGTILVEKAEVTRPVVHVRIGEDGTLDISNAFKSPRKKDPGLPEEENGVPFPFNVKIHQFQIADGSFHFSSVVQGETERAIFEKIHFSLNDVDLAQKSGNVKANLGECKIDMAGIRTGWEDFVIEARVEKGAITPVKAHVESNLLTLHLLGDGRELWEDPVIDMDLRIETALGDIRKTFHLRREFSGPVKIMMQAKGKVSDPRVNMVLSFGGGRIYDVDTEAFTFEGILSDRVVTLTAKGVKATYGNAALSGTVDLKKAFPQGFLSANRNIDAAVYRVTAALDHVNLKGIPLGATLLDGDLQSEVRIEGSGITPANLDAKVKVSLSVTGKTRIAKKIPANFSLNADAALSGKNAEVDHFELRMGETTLAGTGTYQWKSKAITSRISVAAPDIGFTAAIFGFTPVSGNLNGVFDVGGLIQSPIMDLQVSGNALVFKDIRIGDLFADLHYESGRLQVGLLQAENEGALFSVSGSTDVLNPRTLKPVEDPSWDLALEGRDLRLKDFNENVDGRISLSGRLKGSLRRPEGKVLLSGDRLVLFGQKIENFSLNTRMQGGRVYLEPMRITIDAEEVLEGKGWISFSENTFSGSLFSDGVSLKHIHWLEAVGIDGGKATLDISGKGSLDSPQASGSITITGIEIEGKRIEAVRLQTSLINDVLQVHAESDFDIEGRFHFKDREFKARASFTELDLGPYFRMAQLGEWTGILSGTIDCRGNADRPEAIRAEVDLSRLILLFEKQALVQSRSFKASLRDSRILISDIRLGLLNQGSAEIRGTAGLDGDMNLSVQASIPLSGLGPIVPQLGDFAGDAVLAGTVRGPLSRPEIAGKIRLNRVKVTLPEILEEIHDLNAVVDVNPAALKVETIAGKMGEGRFEVKGNIGLKGLAPSTFDLSLDASRIPFSIPEALDLTIGGRLLLTGNQDHSVLKGEVVLEEGVYYKNVALNPIQGLQEQKREAETSPAKPLHPILKNMALDVSFRQRSPFVVDNNIALLNIVSNLLLKGNPAQPQLLGRAQVQEGTVTFLGREFKINRGTIDFINPYRIEPTIDIESKIDIRSWTILLNILGTPDNLVFTKSSKPSESDEDILLLLTAGKTRQEMIREKGGAWISSKVLAAQAASGLVGESVKDATGLDILEAKYLEKDDEFQSEGVEVTVGKRLSKRLTVKYSLETRGGETTQRASSEYKLIENVAASAYQENTGNYGVEMVYRLEFR